MPNNGILGASAVFTEAKTIRQAFELIVTRHSTHERGRASARGLNYGVLLQALPKSILCNLAGCSDDDYAGKVSDRGSVPCCHRD